jgi:hypothetical protein
MTTSTLFHTQGIRGFKYQKTQRIKGIEYYSVHSTASRLSCPCCGSQDTVIAKTGKTRDIRGLHIGLKKRFCESRYVASFVRIAGLALKSRFLFVRGLT